MSQAISTVPSIVSRGSAGRARFIETAAAFVRDLATEWRVRRAMLAIGQLDARSLADIGVGPGQAESAVRFGRSRIKPATARPAPDAPLMPTSFSEWR